MTHRRRFVRIADPDDNIHVRWWADWNGACSPVTAGSRGPSASGAGGRTLAIAGSCS